MWFGRLPYGKCDIVRGECFVATEFVHICWLPLIPIQSWVIIEGSIESYDDYVGSFKLRWEGVPIRFSWKSLLMALIRTSLLMLAIACGLYLGFLFLHWLGGQRPIIETVVALGVLAIALAVYVISLKCVFANAERSAFLCGLLASKYGQNRMPTSEFS